MKKNKKERNNKDLRTNSNYYKKDNEIKKFQINLFD